MYTVRVESDYELIMIVMIALLDNRNRYHKNILREI